MTIQDSALREYAVLLANNGFTIYEPGGPWNFFIYSRIVDGRECFGYVQREQVGSGYTHSMPIKPSKESGSHMVVRDVPNELTIEVATATARPKNFGEFVGWHENYWKPAFSGSYTTW